MSENKDSIEKKDYLSVDNPIPGQNYVCISFVSPEKLIQDFKAFQMCKFLQSYCKDLDLKYDEIYSKYEDYIYKYSEELQRDYDEKNEYKTSMRGIKVRGVYNTREEAENRARNLSRSDSTFNVFVGQVGYWLPWDPCADNVDKEVFQNDQLNQLMEGYEKNNINREIFYEELKNDKIQAAKDEYMAAKKKREEEEKKLEEENKRAEEKTKEIEGNDNNDNDTVTEGTTLEEIKDEPLPEENVDYTLNKDINDSMEDIDPWMARKLEESKKDVNDTDENTDNTTNDSDKDSSKVNSNQ